MARLIGPDDGRGSGRYWSADPDGGRHQPEHGTGGGNNGPHQPEHGTGGGNNGPHQPEHGTGGNGGGGGHDIVLPIAPIETDDDELRIVLERARLIAEELQSVFRPVNQAMHDGAWVSRLADEFSLELDDNRRQLGMTGDRAIEAIEELVRRGRPDDDIETLPGTYPPRFDVQTYSDGSYG